MVPVWVWRGALAGLALLIVMIAAGALLLAMGAADPPVSGPLQLDLVLDGDEGTVWLPEPYTHQLEAARPLPAVSRFTVEVVARLAGGPASAAYGLWLWNCDGIRQQVFALTGDRYAAWFAPGDSPPWAWFPHVQAAPLSNRLRLWADSEQITLYANSEIVRVVAPRIAPVCAWGLYASAGETGGVRVEFERVRAWYPPNSD